MDFAKIFLFFNVMIILSIINSSAENKIKINGSNDTVYSKNILEPNEIILKYKNILEEDSRGHRTYLENLYTIGVSIFGVLGGIFLGVLYFSWGKTKREVRSQVEENFKLKVDEIIKEQTERIEILYKRKLNTFTKYTNNMLIDLASKALITHDDQPLPDVNYEELKGKKILWVDDKPDNNLQHREIFGSFGVDFDIAKDTEEAKKMISPHNNYDLIISNMGRPPKIEGEDNPREGLVFLKWLKDNGITTPRIIYTKPVNVESYSDEVNRLNSSITHGYTGLFKEILRNLSKSYGYLGK
jgi:CheY-like chemotaxis protein